jgi:two-component system alkaline phosphatase synthesis response regulator PhoP
MERADRNERERDSLMSRERVLVVDDEEDILELVSYNLTREGFQVECVGSGNLAIRAARSWRPDIILLDLMLPGIDGLEICRLLKNDPETNAISVIMLTAKGEEADIVAGLELGADDYITKPFSHRVLVARVRAICRRKTRDPEDQADGSRLVIHNLVIDPLRHEVHLDDTLIDLTLTEFRLLSWLARHPGRVFTRQQIIDAIRGDDYPVTERSVDVQVVALRRKLAPHDDYIETVRGVGYRFKG